MSTQSKPHETTTHARAPSRLLLSLVLAASLSGCASQSTLPPPLDQGLIDLAAQQHLQMHENYRPLSMPRELMKEPAPPGYFSSRVADDFERWRKLLMSSPTKSAGCTATQTPC